MVSLNEHIFRCILFLEKNNGICDQTFRYRDKIVRIEKVFDRNRIVKGYCHSVIPIRTTKPIKSVKPIKPVKPVKSTKPVKPVKPIKLIDLNNQ